MSDPRVADVPKKGSRPRVPKVPEQVRRLLTELNHPSRLPILLALEQRPRTARELCDDLGLKPDEVQYALGRLRRYGLVTVTADRMTYKNFRANVYKTRRGGWSEILQSLKALAK